MKEEDLDLETMRRRFAAEGDTATGECPTPERLWAAVHRELPAGERDVLLDHLGACPACAEDWRLAVELARREQQPAGGRVLPLRRLGARRYAPLLPAIAASVLLVAVGLGWQRSRTEQAIERGNEPSAVRSLVDAARPLPRERALLRWSALPGARYDVWVHSEDMDLLAAEQGLTRSEYLVPESALAGLPRGARLVWRIEAEPPGGERVSSDTFVIPLQ